MSRVVATFHPPSAVVASVKCVYNGSDYLVIAKSTLLEVFRVQADGLHKEGEPMEIWGRVLGLWTVPHTSVVIALLDHPEPQLLFFLPEIDGAGVKLQLSNHVPLYERAHRPAEFLNSVVVHPSGKFLILSIYASKIKVVPLDDNGIGSEGWDVSLAEINLLSLCFLPTDEEEEEVFPIALLHINHQNKLHLLARDLSLAELGFTDSEPSVVLKSTFIPSKLISQPHLNTIQLVPVPPLAGSESDGHGGVLIIGGEYILYYESTSFEVRQQLIAQKEKKKSEERSKGRGSRQSPTKTRAKERSAKKKGSSSKNEDEEPEEKDESREAEIKLIESEDNKRRKAKAVVQWPWSEISAYCPLDGFSEGSSTVRYLLGDSFGRFALLLVGTGISLEPTNQNKIHLGIIGVGQSSAADTLTSLSGGHIFLGSASGNSYVVKISGSPLPGTQGLPIPPSLKTLTSQRLASLTGGKGKAAERSEDQDVDMSEKTVNYQEKGWVLSNEYSFLHVLDEDGEFFGTSIAPVRDALLVDLDGTGMNQIITASGSQNTGRLCIIRTGADFEIFGSLNGIVDGGVHGVWAIKSKDENWSHSHILVSTLMSSYLLNIESGSPRNTQVTFTLCENGDFARQPTLVAGNIKCRSPSMSGTLAIQVTSEAVHLLEFDELVLGEWQMKHTWLINQRRSSCEIISAVIGQDQVLLALSGGFLVILFVEDDELKESLPIAQVASMSASSSSLLKNEISSIAYASFGTSMIIAVGFWHSKMVHLYSLDMVKQTVELACKSQPLSAPVRSTLFHTFLSNAKNNGGGMGQKQSYLMAGLTDGTVVALRLERKGGGLAELADMKIVGVGETPCTLFSCKVDGQSAVLATGSRTMLISWDSGRLCFSPVVLNDTTAIASINTSLFPDCLVITTSNGLHVGQVRGLNKTHVRSISFGYDNPVCLAHDTISGLLGVVCQRNEAGRIADYRPVQSSFRLVDDCTFQYVAHFNSDANEEMVSLVTLSLQSSDNTTASFFCVGTYVDDVNEIEPSKGRLLVLKADKRSDSATLILVASASTQGCVYSLTVVEDKLVAAVNSSVCVYTLERSGNAPSSSYSLSMMSEWNHNYIVTQLTSVDNRLVAADRISSVSLLEVLPNGKLVTVARDYGPLWPLVIATADRNSIIGANDSFNLFSFSLNSSSQRAVLTRDGDFHIGDNVTRILKGCLGSRQTSHWDEQKQDHIFFSITGRIGVIVHVEDHTSSKILRDAQRKLANTAKGVGADSHARYRAPKNMNGRSDADEASYGFLDGDLLERGLDQLESEQGSGPESVVKLRELLQAIQDRH